MFSFVKRFYVWFFVIIKNEDVGVNDGRGMGDLGFWYIV